MRLKYQLRGLGIGMILGVLLMGVFTGTREETLTDAQIKERAKALGMEEARVLSDLPETTTEATTEMMTETASETETETTPETETKPITSEEESAKKEEVSSSTEEMSETGQAADKKTTSTEVASMDLEVSAEEKMVLITIKSGDGSGTVSFKLEQAGLIKDADAYDKYLCKNGYDKKIRVGNHEIPYGATEEEIAKSISSK